MRPGLQGLPFALRIDVRSDSRPGRAPDVQRLEDVVLVTFPIDGLNGQTIFLVVRCHRDGELTASITTKPQARSE